jgi:hypothetical protein
MLPVVCPDADDPARRGDAGREPLQEQVHGALEAARAGHRHGDALGAPPREGEAREEFSDRVKPGSGPGGPGSGSAVPAAGGGEEEEGGGGAGKRRRCVIGVASVRVRGC